APGPATHFWKYALSGWSIAGITSFQSGAPFTVSGDISNPNAPLNSRAILSQNCAPDISARTRTSASLPPTSTGFRQLVCTMPQPQAATHYGPAALTTLT